MNYYVAYSVILYGNTNNTIILVLNLIIAGIVHCLVTQYSIVYRFGGKPAPSDSTLYSSHKQMYFKLLSFSSLRYLVRGHITESHIEEEQRLPYFFSGHCYIFIPCSALILFFSSIYHLYFLHYPERNFPFILLWFIRFGSPTDVRHCQGISCMARVAIISYLMLSPSSYL